MQLIHAWDAWPTVPARWEQAFGKDKDPKMQAITKQLAALAPDELTGERIEAIIGNTLWTRQKCDNCFQEKDTLCRLGDGDECDTVDVCLSCIKDAIVLMTEAA